MPPLVSILLPVYNGDQYLVGAVSSILSQADCDFEIVIINDGSTDTSANLIRQFKDHRIRCFDQENRGLPATLNRAIALAQGTYLARQDQDDLSFPGRLGRQASFLDVNPDVGMIGTWAEIWVENDKTSRLHTHPTDDASLKFHLLFDNPFVHSSVMIRRSVFDEVGCYTEDPSRQPPEDYELWSRVARKFRVANLPEVLLAYREVGDSMSRLGEKPFLRNLMRISAENIAWASGREAETPEVVALSRLSHGVYDDIPRGVHFSTLKTVLQEAAKHIACESGISSKKMEGLVQRSLLRLRFHCLAHRSGGLLAKVLGGSPGRFAKEVTRKMWTVWRP